MRKFVQQIDAKLVLVGGLFLFLIVPRLSFVPIWDGRFYADSILEAIRTPFDLPKFNCAGHPTMLWGLWIGLFQIFDPGSPFLLHLPSVLLGLASVVAFFKIAKTLFPEPATGSEIYLLAGIFSVFPAIVAATLETNPDSGVLAFFMILLALLLAKKFRLAVVASIFLVCSKESGLLLYVLAMGIGLLLFFFSSRRDLRRAIPEGLRRSGYFLPLGAYLLVQGSLKFTNEQSAWSSLGGGARHILALFVRPSVLSLGANNPYLAGLFVVNFNWILSALLMVALISVALSGVRRQLHARLRHTTCHVLYICLLFGASFYVLTRFPTFGNPRYILPVYPLLLLVVYAALKLLWNSHHVRLGMLCVIFTAVFASNYRTIDPVSKLVFGTFSFGSHSMLKMTSLMAECCGYGRDQLVYDLEYTHYHYIQNQMYSAIRPTQRTAIVEPDDAEWFLGGPLDSRTFHRTLRSEGSFQPRYFRAGDVPALKTMPRKIIFIDYPNFDTGAALRRLEHLYQITDRQRYGTSGYWITVYRMHLIGKVGRANNGHGRT